MTPAEHDIVIAMCARAAECWADGHVEIADRWFGGAMQLVVLGDFRDVDEVSR